MALAARPLSDWANQAILMAGQAAEAQRMVWPDGARAAIVLTYDDAVPSQLDIAIPALDSAGLKGTFFLSNVRQADVERWNAAAASGHELANHTLNHPLGLPSERHIKEVVLALRQR